MNALEIRNLSKKYGSFVLQNLNLTLPGGCILGLIGENGAGKTTTIKLILDMIRRDSGSIRILGRDNREDLALVKQDIGVVLDEVGLNECLTAKQVGKIMAGIYTRWDAAQYAAYLTRLRIPADQRFKTFSRGTRMKLGIAVALSHGARLLILDEATSGLDPVVREEVVELFREFTRDARNSVLISSHIVSDLEKICDYVAFLHRGRLLLCEEKDQLLERYGMLHATPQQLSELEPGAVLAKRILPYDTQALVRRSQVPVGMQVQPVSMEELFIFMVKEAG